MNYSTIDYQVQDGVATILLNRPESFNSVNSLMSQELPLVWDNFNNDDSAIVAIISGSGDKSFCTGADLADLPDINT